MSGHSGPAGVLLAAGWVGEATAFAMEAGTGGVTAMLAGIMAARTAEGWEEEEEEEEEGGGGGAAVGGTWDETTACCCC